MKNDKRGKYHSILVLVIILVAIIGGSYYMYLRNSQVSQIVSTSVSSSTQQQILSSIPPRTITSSQGVYMVKLVTAGPSAYTQKLYKIAGSSTTEVLIGTFPTLSVVYDSNNNNDLYVILGIDNGYKIVGTQAIPITGLNIIEDNTTLSYFSYVNSVWYLIVNKFDFNNNAEIYKIDGTTAMKIPGLDGYNKFSISSVGSSTYVSAVKIVPGFCGDSPCYSTNKINI